MIVHQVGHANMRCLDISLQLPRPISLLALRLVNAQAASRAVREPILATTAIITKRFWVLQLAIMHRVYLALMLNHLHITQVETLDQQHLERQSSALSSL